MLAAPGIALGVWLVTVVAALPMAVAVQHAIADHLGASVLAERVAAGVDRQWWIEFTSATRGVADTLTPEVIGFAAVLSNLSRLLDPERLPPSLVAAVALYLAAWLFLWGGILDRYARARRVGPRAFFGACGLFFGRLVRLALLAGLGWVAVAAWGWLLLGRGYPWLTRDVADERVALAWYAVCAVGTLLPALALMLVADYARVRAVVEDRRSMVGAIVAAVRFIRRHARSVVVLALANGLVWMAVLAAYAAAAPGVGGAWPLLAVLGIGQAYILARLLTRLAFLSTATVLFQQSLAHAGYTALPPPVWPDSPAAEAIENAARYGVRPPT